MRRIAIWALIGWVALPTACDDEETVRQATSPTAGAKANGGSAGAAPSGGAAGANANGGSAGATPSGGSAGANANGGSAGSVAGGSGGSSAGGSSAGAAGSAPCLPDPSMPDEDLGTGGDPTGGNFDLDAALAGLPDGPGPLRAIVTVDQSLGTFTCEFRPDVAPVGVANFVGLARGTRPWKDPKTKHWVKRRFYDGLTFHRVIPGFVIQGGDPLGTGTGGPGYTFDNEIGDLTHTAGALAYANTGKPKSNGSQFYVTTDPQPDLDGGYTIFGQCDSLDVVQAVAAVPTDKNDKPLTPVHMQTVVITRCAK